MFSKTGRNPHSAGYLAASRSVLRLAGVPRGAKCNLIELPHY